MWPSPSPPLGGGRGGKEGHGLALIWPCIRGGEDGEERAPAVYGEGMALPRPSPAGERE